MRETLNQFLRYAAAGAVATTVHYGVLISLAELAGVRPLHATIVGFLAGAVVGYSLNRRYVFAARPAYGRGLVKFLVVVSVGAFINASIFAFFVSQGLHYLVAQVIATCIVLIWNYAGSRFLVFRG